MARIDVPAGTGNQGIFGFGQGSLPGGRRRPQFRIPVAVCKAATDQLDELRMKAVEIRDVFGGTDREGWGSCVWEGSLGDASFDGGRVAAPQPLRPERVATLH